MHYGQSTAGAYWPVCDSEFQDRTVEHITFAKTKLAILGKTSDKDRECYLCAQEYETNISCLKRPKTGLYKAKRVTNVW